MEQQNQLNQAEVIEIQGGFWQDLTGLLNGSCTLPETNSLPLWKGTKF